MFTQNTTQYNLIMEGEVAIYLKLFIIILISHFIIKFSKYLLYMGQ